jgi:hypothetical protein
MGAIEDKIMKAASRSAAFMISATHDMLGHCSPYHRLRFCLMVEQRLKLKIHS